jgi:hypothetical protein
MAKIRDLGLPLVSVKRVESDPQVAFQEKKPCKG